MAQVNVRLADALAQFDGTGNLTEWLQKLERVAKLQKITKLADLLPLFLTGGAYAVYEGIPESDKEDYDKVKSALLNAFSPNRFDAFDELVARRLGEGESVDVYHAALTNLGALVANEWIRCAFVSGLPEGAQLQLRSSCALGTIPMTEVLEKARSLVKANGGGTGEACFSAVRSASRPAPDDVICYACGKTGHFYRDCRSRSQRRVVRHCFVCGDATHLAARCPHRRESGEQPKKRLGEGATLCAGAFLATSAQLPTVRLQIGGTRVAAILDTGCTKSIIAASLAHLGRTAAARETVVLLNGATTICRTMCNLEALVDGAAVPLECLVSEIILRASGCC